jgi:bacillithiol biosynthesis cysteine-adding enzyme BshC
MTLPRVISEEFTGSRLALAAQRGELSEWYAPRPRTGEGWREYLSSVSARHQGKQWLDRLRPALEPKGAAKTRLEGVLDRNGVVVSTGQQAALFGGPLYTLVKAISALTIANALEQETGIATAPVFWAATDDADYGEANWAGVVTKDGLRTLRLPPRERVGIPMNDVPMPDVERLVGELAEACGSAVDPSALEIVRSCYTSTGTLGTAYVTQLRELLEPLGIAILDASHPAVRLAAEPILLRALDEARGIERALRERYEDIRSAGHTPQVEHLEALTLVFATGSNGEKRRIPIDQATDARARIDVSRMSPNVLLRPIVERFIMPSVAYVAGPGELAYFAQVSAAARVLDVPAPLPLPRWSATIVEPRVERVLARLGATAEELRDRHALEGRLSRERLPADLSGALRQLRADIESDVSALEQADRDGLLPAASLEGLRRSLLHRLERTERRFVAGVKRRETDLMRDIAMAAASLYPDGTRQERVLNFVPFLARYGRPLLDLMRSEASKYSMALVRSITAASPRSMAERV